jgi:hypothetical protein
MPAEDRVDTNRMDKVAILLARVVDNPFPVAVLGVFQELAVVEVVVVEEDLAPVMVSRLEMKSGSSTGIKSSSSTGGHDKNGRSHRAGRPSTASTLGHQF